MSPALKYSLGRIAIFVAVAVPVFVVVPIDNAPLKLMIAIVVSAAVAFFALRRWREDLANQLAENARRKQRQRQQLRSALAGEDGSGAPAAREDTGDGSASGDQADRG